MDHEKKKERLLIIIIILLILLIAFSICFLLRRRNVISLDISNRQISATNPNLYASNDNEYFELLGYGELQIDENNKNINLINTDGNNVYLKFSVIYDDNVLYETELIEPGKMEQYDIYSNLNAGKYTLTYSIDVIDMNTSKTTWSGIKQQQDINIIKGEK